MHMVLLEWAEWITKIIPIIKKESPIYSGIFFANAFKLFCRPESKNVKLLLSDIVFRNLGKVKPFFIILANVIAMIIKTIFNMHRCIPRTAPYAATHFEEYAVVNGQTGNSIFIAGKRSIGFEFKQIIKLAILKSKVG